MPSPLQRRTTGLRIIRLGQGSSAKRWIFFLWTKPGGRRHFGAQHTSENDIRTRLCAFLLALSMDWLMVQLVRWKQALRSPRSAFQCRRCGTTVPPRIFEPCEIVAPMDSAIARAGESWSFCRVSRRKSTASSDPSSRHAAAALRCWEAVAARRREAFISGHRVPPTLQRFPSPRSTLRRCPACRSKYTLVHAARCDSHSRRSLSSLR
jgi:hypothetical protein